MHVEFRDVTKSHWKTTFMERHMNAIPRKGDVVIHHEDDGSKEYRVQRVVFVAEDREWGKKNQGDSVVIDLTPL